jgi:hypothetical protein
MIIHKILESRYELMGELVDVEHISKWKKLKENLDLDIPFEEAFKRACKK